MRLVKEHDFKCVPWTSQNEKARANGHLQWCVVLWRSVFFTDESWFILVYAEHAVGMALGW